MKIWLPYVYGDSGGGAVFTERLAGGLRALGHDVVSSAFPHRYQFFPWPLRYVSPPSNIDVVIANSWWAFPFKNFADKLVVIEHHCVHDPAFAPYRSFPQAAYHELFLRRFTANSLRKADAVVCISEHTARTMEKVWNGIHPAVIYNGIDIDFFCPGTDPKPPLANRPVRLLYVGNLIRRKGVDLLPKIITTLGPGFELGYTSGLLADDPLAGISGMIPLGKLTTEELRDEYRAADLLLFPTRFEGFGYPAAEAMACGTPVVTTRCSSMPEVVEDGVTGRLCKIDDVADFAAKIRKLTADQAVLTRMSEVAVEHANRKFGLDRMAREYHNLIEDLCGQTGI